MKRLTYITWFLSLMITLWSCEDQISPELTPATDAMVVDAWLNNLPQPQTIRLTLSQAYFDNSGAPAITSASVLITDSNGEDFFFIHEGQGRYTWNPSLVLPRLGEVGTLYTLTVNYKGEFYTATSSMNRVPVIDSISYRFEKENIFLPDSYWAEFWARDFEGQGDTYWIKSFKNGEFLNQPNEINIAFDAGFTQGGNVDGLIFIPPIRDTINPFDQDENDDFLSPFIDGDSVYVEIHSITGEAFRFLQEVRIQTDRPGGFAELFAQPLSNVPSNIVNISPNPQNLVLGFFSVSAIESNGRRLDVSEVPLED